MKSLKERRIGLVNAADVKASTTEEPRVTGVPIETIHYGEHYVTKIDTSFLPIIFCIKLCR